MTEKVTSSTINLSLSTAKFKERSEQRRPESSFLLRLKECFMTKMNHSKKSSNSMTVSNSSRIKADQKNK